MIFIHPLDQTPIGDPEDPDWEDDDPDDEEDEEDDEEEPVQMSRF